jgi:WD40 repeat protein
MSDSEDYNEFENTNNKDAAKQMKAKKYDGDDEGQEYDDILGELFERVQPGEGDEFAAVKPWLGAIKEPKSHPKPNKKSPTEDLEIDWVYGYRSEEARQNLSFNSSGKAVYPTAALGVIFDYAAQKQTYFGGGKTNFGGRKQKNDEKDGHNDDVTALCVSFSRKMVASGQNGQKPIVFLWDAETGAVIGKKRLPKGARLVTAIGISLNDKFVCASDASEKITAYIFNTNEGVNPIAEVMIG